MELERMALEKFDEHRANHGGNKTFYTEETLTKVIRASDEAAKRELMRQSSAVRQLDELEKKAAELKAQADAKEAELNAAYQEWLALPTRADQAQERLAVLANERRIYSSDLKAEFKAVYADYLRTGSGSLLVGVDKVTLAIQQAKLRLEVIAEVEPELTAKLKAIQARSRELAKFLSIEQHDI